MIKTTTLEDAISQVFGIDEVPAFKSSKPVKEARAWLESQNIKFDYHKNAQAIGVFVFTRGAGSPQYAVLNDGDDVGGGVQALATLAPNGKAKAKKIENDDVESTPTISNSPEDQADAEMTVPDPKPRKRVARRKK